MKQWTTPAIEELNINETENGWIDVEFESFVLFKDGTNDIS